MGKEAGGGVLLAGFGDVACAADAGVSEFVGGGRGGFVEGVGCFGGHCGRWEVNGFYLSGRPKSTVLGGVF